MRVCVCVPGPKSNNAYDHFQNVLDGFGAVASLEGKVEDRVNWRREHTVAEMRLGL